MSSALLDFPFVAGHPLLDLINTWSRPNGGEFHEYFETDDDVYRWLTLAGFVSKKAPRPNLRPRSLCPEMYLFRANWAAAVKARKEGKPVILHDLNSRLKHTPGYSEIVKDKSGELTMGRRFPSETAQQLLAPVVEAAADFIVHADFSRVHRCEGEDCVLWFYDRTKARLRRWCSMETCGNRKKISAFRERKD